jgi:hypothetical protein
VTEDALAKLIVLRKAMENKYAMHVSVAELTLGQPTKFFLSLEPHARSTHVELMWPRALAYVVEYEL